MPAMTIHRLKPPTRDRHLNRQTQAVASIDNESEAIMKTPRVLALLTIVNLVLLGLGLLQHIRPAYAQGELPVLRGRALEIVDSQGRVRASISVMPRSGGESETVLLRLITERGRPSVKIGSSEPQSGLSFAGPTGTRDTYVILKAEGRSASLKMRAEDGSERTIQP